MFQLALLFLSLNIVNNLPLLSDAAKINHDQGVNFYLYTRTNPRIASELYFNNLNSIRASQFDQQNPTRFIIHGWMSHSEDEINRLIRDAFLSTGPYNVIVVNWKTKSMIPYTTACTNILHVGQQVAGFIDFMAKYGYIKPQNLTIIGHSLGAHVSGSVGRSLRSGQLHTIIGLDPASPLFPYESSRNRLHPTDAYYVETIQTNGANAGFVKPIGKATFYPNGGQKQPGCGIDPFGTCAHFRAYKFYAEAITTNGFPSIKCSSQTQAVEKKCGHIFSKTVRMGAESNADNASGVFYVPVRATSPYAVERLHNKE